MGWWFDQNPPGLRKSGMPDSVLIPAPVNTTARLLASKSVFSSPITSACLLDSRDIVCLRNLMFSAKQGKRKVLSGDEGSAKGGRGDAGRRDAETRGRYDASSDCG